MYTQNSGCPVRKLKLCISFNNRKEIKNASILMMMDFKKKIMNQL